MAEQKSQSRSVKAGRLRIHHRVNITIPITTGISRSALVDSQIKISTMFIAGCPFTEPSAPFFICSVAPPRFSFRVNYLPPVTNLSLSLRQAFIHNKPRNLQAKPFRQFFDVHSKLLKLKAGDSQD
jgi:hypothetical protein